MSTLTLYPLANSDDSMYTPSGAGYFDDVYTKFSLGYSWVGAVATMYLRFPGLVIAKGSTINSVTLSLYARVSTALTGAKTKIFCNASDNAVAPTTEAQFLALVDTSAFVAWDPGAWTGNAEYSPGDLSSPFNEVFTRPGFAYGNAIAFVIRENSGLSRTKYAWCFNEATPAYYPKLVVDYTPLPPPDHGKGAKTMVIL